MILIWKLFLTFIFYLLICHAQEQSPNILLILSDDLGSSDVSYNLKLLDPNLKPQILTPNIDFLADNGIKLTNYYTLPICGPARAALLTSKLPFRLGNPFPTAMGYGDLTAHVSTIAHELKKRNYMSHFIGKWGVDDGGQHFNVVQQRWVNSTEDESSRSPFEGDTDGKGPIARGFDTFYGLYNSAHHHYTKRILYAIDWHSHNQTHWLDYPDLDAEKDQYSTHLFTRETMNTLQKYSNKNNNNKQPFFIHLSYSAPHDPLMVPKHYEQSSTCASIPNWRRKTFCGMVRCVDEGIGNITQTLKKLNLFDNTIVIWTSDNGGFLYVGGRNYPYRGYKGGIWEGGIHVPALIHAPRYLNGGGRIYRDMFHVVDWAPTLLSLIDNINGNTFKHELEIIDGKDLSLSLLNSEEENLKNKKYKRESILLGADPFSNGTALRRGDYKLILGMGGLDTVTWEPDSFWTVNRDQINWSDRLEESLVNLLDTISEDLFPFAWSIHILLAAYRDLLWGTTYANVHAHPMDTKLYRPMNETFPIILPHIQWKSPTSTPRVYLYNLKNDPFEKINIAESHKQLVEDMTKEIIETIKDAPPQIGAIHCTFHNFILMIDAGVISSLLFLVLISYCCCCRGRCCTKKKKDKTKNQ